MKYSFNLDLLSGISVLVTIGSLMMVTVFLLPAAVHRAPAALASGLPTPAAALR